MKFVCDSCNTKYSIADERVHGRVLKIRCKTCDHVITVREEAKPQPPTPSNIAETLSQFQNEDHTVVSMPPPSAPEAPPPQVDDWYVSFDGEQEGPMALQRAIERVRAERPFGKESHCWRPGFFVWLSVEEVPEMAPALQKKAAAPPPKPKSPSGSVPALKSPTGPQARLDAKLEPKLDAKPPTPKNDSKNDSKPVPKLDLKPPTPKPDPKNDSKPVPKLDLKPELKPELKPALKPEPKPALKPEPKPALKPEPKPALKPEPLIPPKPEPLLAPKPEPLIPKLEPIKAPLPLIDSKPIALPPPPEPLSNATPLNLPLPLIPPMPQVDSIPMGPMSGQLTKPEPRLTRRALEEADDKKKPEREPSAPEVSAFVAALAAAKGEEPKTPDTGPVPLPPPPGSDPDLAIGEPSGLLSISHLAQPSLARTSEKQVIDTFGGVAVTPPGSNGTASAAPVVVVAGPVQSTAAWVKYTIGVLLVLVVGLGAMLVYKSRVPVVEKPPAPEPASAGRRVDDKPIQLAEPAPNTTIGLPSDVKKTAPAPQKHVSATPKSPTAAPKLSNEQKSLAALYGDSGGEKGTPKDTTLADRAQHSAGSQVSETSILAVVTQNRRALNLCYDRVLKHDSSLKRARLVTHVKVGISGAVLNVSVPDPEYANSEIGVCLTQTIKHWHFPAADAEYETQFPIILQAE